MVAPRLFELVVNFGIWRGDVEDLGVYFHEVLDILDGLTARGISLFIRLQHVAERFRIDLGAAVDIYILLVVL